MDKLIKYSGDTSDQILTYLKRNLSVYEVGSDFFDKPWQMVLVGDRSYPVESNKKFLVNLIYSKAKDVFPNTDVKVLRRTIKKYLDGISE
jgi:hypothetical protein